MTSKEIIASLPYSSPFLFVDEITSVNLEGIEGRFHFHEDLSFYEGHFKNNPITPGVILIETMAQIGLVSFGIYLFQKSNETLKDIPSFAMTSAEVYFLFPVFPGEKVIVKSKKEYFRFGKLKCAVEMVNSKNQKVCEGFIAGMLLSKNYGK